MASELFYRWRGDTLLLSCQVQPGSSEERLVGKIGNALKIRLKAAPADGKAKKQLIKVLSRQFQVKQSAITIVSGHSSQQKVVNIERPNSIPEFLTAKQEPAT